MNKILKRFIIFSIIFSIIIAIIDFIAISLTGASVALMTVLSIVAAITLLVIFLIMSAKLGYLTLKFALKLFGILAIAALICIVILAILFATIPLFLISIITSII